MLVKRAIQLDGFLKLFDAVGELAAPRLDAADQLFGFNINAQHLGADAVRPVGNQLASARRGVGNAGKRVELVPHADVGPELQVLVKSNARQRFVQFRVEPFQLPDQPCACGVGLDGGIRVVHGHGGS